MQTITDLTSSSALCCRARATWWVLCRESAWSRDWKSWRKLIISIHVFALVPPPNVRVCVCIDLYGLLEALVFPLQLLSLRQTAGVQHAGRQHDLTFGDPAQHLSYTHTGRQVFSPGSARVCVCVWVRVFVRESPVWPGFAGVSAAGSVPAACVCDLQSAAAPSVCPVGGAAAPPLAQTAPLLPPTARYLTRTQTTLHPQTEDFCVKVLRRTEIQTGFISHPCVCLSAWMPLRVYLYGKFNTLVSMGTSCVLQRAVSMTTLFPLPPLSSLPLFPLISSVCSWTGQTDARLEHRNADDFASVSFSSPWFCSSVFYSV